jgi:hypothetical protein
MTAIRPREGIVVCDFPKFVNGNRQWIPVDELEPHAPHEGCVCDE